jgi:hypothetical protein
MSYQKRMTIPQVQYYLHRMRLFWSLARIAEELETTILSVRRWQANETQPPLFRLGDFDAALKQLHKELRRKAKSPQTQFYNGVADALIEDDVPEYRDPLDTAPQPDELRERLVDLLYQKSMKSSDVFAHFPGVSRARLYHAADQVGIVRQHAVKGRNGYSLWSLGKK